MSNSKRLAVIGSVVASGAHRRGGRRRDVLQLIELRRRQRLCREAERLRDAHQLHGLPVHQHLLHLHRPNWAAAVEQQLLRVRAVGREAAVQ